jgi:hypothetical protein
MTISYRLILTWRWRPCVPTKRRLTFNLLHSVIYQKMALSVTTALRSSNPTYLPSRFHGFWVRDLIHKPIHFLIYQSFAHDSGRTLVRAEYGYPKASPHTNSYRRNPPLQLSIQCSPQRTSKWPNSKPHWAARQQAIANTPAKWSAYQIPSVTVVFVILVLRFSL